MKFEDVRPTPHFLGERCFLCNEADYRHPREGCSEFVSKMLQIVHTLGFEEQLKIAGLNYFWHHPEMLTEVRLVPVDDRLIELELKFKLGIFSELEQRVWVECWLPKQSSGYLGKYLVKKDLIKEHELYANVNPPKG